MQKRQGDMTSGHSAQLTIKSRQALMAMGAKAGLDVSIHGTQSDQPTLLTGDLNMSQGISGIQTQCCDHVETQTCKVCTTLPPGLVLVYLLNGAVQFELDDTHHRLTSCLGKTLGFAFNLTSHTRFVRHLQKGNSVKKLVVTLCPDLLTRIAAHYPLLNSPTQDMPHLFTYQWTASEEQQIRCQTIIGGSSSDSLAPLIQESNVLALIQSSLDHLLNAKGPRVTASHPMSESTKIKQHIDSLISNGTIDHYDLSSLAKKLNMSNSKLQRSFKFHCGVGVMEYIRTQRLTIAKQAMINNGISIGEAAFLAGYKHASNFCLAFKKTFGFNPGKI